jgi:Outer membrane protein beta-barrel domain
MLHHARHFALLATALLACSTTMAQDDRVKKAEEAHDEWNGIRFGYHLSNFDGEESADARSGFYGGYYRNIIKVPLYSLSTGLEYNTAGASIGNYELRLGYLTLPVNNRLKFGPVYTDIGFALAMKMGEKALLDGAEVEIDEKAEADRFDVVAHVGAGVKFLMIGAELRYRHALTEAFDGYRNTGWEIGLCTFF